MRRMVAPSLPAGWRFLRATVLDRAIRAAYAHPSSPTARAELHLTHPDLDADAPRTARFALRLLGSRGAPAMAALRDALVASVHAHEAHFTWRAVSLREPEAHPDPSPTPDEAPPPPLPAAPENPALTLAKNAFAEGRFDEALADLDAFIATVASPAAQHDALALAVTLRQSIGRLRESFDTLGDALARHPSSATLHALAARFDGESHRTERAALHARTLASLAGDGAGLTLRAAVSLLDAGLTDEARTLARSLDDVAHTGTAGLRADLAALHRRLGDFTRAEALYRDALTRDPTHPRALDALASLHAWRGDLDALDATARTLREAHPDDASAWRWTGAAHLLRGHSHEALAALDRALARNPDDGECLLWRGEALLRLGDFTAAYTAARDGGVRASDLGAHLAAQLVMALAQLADGRFTELAPDVDRAVDALLAESADPLHRTDDTTHTARFERALRALRGNRTATATFVDRHGALRVLELPFSPREASKRALWRFAATDDPDEALRAFASIHARAPDAAEPYNYRGEMHLYRGDARSAREEFHRALSRYARSRWAHIGLSGAALLNRSPLEALDHLARSIALAGPPGPTAFAYRGEALRLLGRRREARDDLTTAVTQHPRRIGAWVNLGLLDLDDGDLDGARTVWRTLARRADGMVYDLARDGGPSPDDRASADVLRAAFEALLAMLRGNRGASCVTYYTRAGVLRTVPPQRNV